VKRLFDIVCSALALGLLAPLLLPVVMILRLTGEGEVFYRQQRVGKDGKMFGLLKFATMLKDSPNIGTGVLTTKNDPRVLPFGRFLRKTKINELPQLINILVGNMSIIGPRPQAKAHFDVFPDQLKCKIIKVLPGLSGIGSIIFRDEENIISNGCLGSEIIHNTIIAPYKGALEVWYVENSSLLLDIILIALTVWHVIFPKSRICYNIFWTLPPPPSELIGLVCEKT
jgi:lipopolysaccharide/colanic/teichoic acid biosynthesis glycosyltransferase